MRGSIRIAKMFGIPVFVHWSFSLLFLFVIYIGKSRDASWENIGVFGLFVIALFTCVLLHEFGHALSAKYFGVNTRDVTILPIGGVARLDHLPEKPIQEFVVAIAGPAVNVAIYLILSLVLYFGYSLKFSITDLIFDESNEMITDPLTGFLATLLQANAMLVFFNMIPAFPMDGGRVLRALLSIPLGRLQATKIAALLGQVIAIGFLIYALLPAIVKFIPHDEHFASWCDWIDWHFQPVLTLISGFVFYSARNEYQQVILEEKLNKYKAYKIARTDFTSFLSSEPIHSAIQELSKGQEKNFLVFDNENILRGMLLEADIIDAMKNRHYDALVSSYTTTRFEKINSGASLKEAYDKMYRTGQSILPVLNESSLMPSTPETTLSCVMGIIDIKSLEDLVYGA